MAPVGLVSRSINRARQLASLSQSSDVSSLREPVRQDAKEDVSVKEDADAQPVQKKKIDTLIMAGLKRILEIPQTTSTKRLLELRLHNTVDELIAAHFAAQVARLSSTNAGLKILDEADIAAPRVEVSDGVQLTRDQREDIQVDPIPRNIHSVHHAGRRSNAKVALFMGAAEYSTRLAFGVLVVDGKGQLVARASVCAQLRRRSGDRQFVSSAGRGALYGLLGFKICRSGLLWRFDFAAGGTAPSVWWRAGEMCRRSPYPLVSSARR
ncbi:hypothetical protein HPB50_013879 [Hyalomma asiaticum]|uniref:Uncharacterized protein n=1 Tax=Hyalomma asiaticum TaxID=266040 RepID=A0ACB7SEF7_HYAAI|nr:hypothetical protein HPB50_013879 [Hyalomma asiaticum]